VGAEQNKEVVFYGIERKVKELLVLEQSILSCEFNQGHATAGHEPGPAVKNKKHTNKARINHKHKLEIFSSLPLQVLAHDDLHIRCDSK